MDKPDYFFCGIGGSGMLPLAMYLREAGSTVEGSDRAIDQGRGEETRRRLAPAGISIFPQDGSGVRSDTQILVTSSAVEATIPDVAAAQAQGLAHIIRAELLSQLTNAAPFSCGIAGTSGKSTTTAMLAHILAEAGLDPSVINGAPILNFLDQDARPKGWRRGEGPFVCEVDESDGSIARYNPSVGVILNVSEDHKPMAELKELFGGYAERAGRAILGVDSEPVAAIADSLPDDKVVRVSLEGPGDYCAQQIQSTHAGLVADLVTPEGPLELRLPLIGAFNVGNALAAMAAAAEVGVKPDESARALLTFRGSARRLQTIGVARGVTVIDDFAHNPEKIAGSIGALKKHYERLHLFYQPHGYGPLAQFRALYEDAFAASLGADDQLTISEPAFFGGTVTKTEDAQVMVRTLAERGFAASFATEREHFASSLAAAEAGDAVIIMGARDDSLTTFAKACLARLEQAA